VEKSVQIIVAFHKHGRHNNSNLFLNVHVGKALSEEQLPFEGDDTGDNISKLNPYFCELTAVYWAWRNSKLVDITGLCHYRRYFNIRPSWLESRKQVNKVKTSTFNFERLSNKASYIDSTLRKYDIILPRKMNLKKSIEAFYLEYHTADEWNTMLNVMNEIYPEYKAHEFFRATTTMHSYNMLICSKKIAEKYFTWLFEILFTIHQRVSPQTDAYQKRSIGFLSERLLNLFVYHNGLKVKELPTFYLED
jgi:hypothetical protein